MGEHLSFLVVLVFVSLSPIQAIAHSYGPAPNFG